MELNWRILREVYQSVADGDISLENADRWASSIVRAEDKGVLSFYPDQDRAPL